MSIIQDIIELFITKKESEYSFKEHSTAQDTVRELIDWRIAEKMADYFYLSDKKIAKVDLMDSIKILLKKRERIIARHPSVEFPRIDIGRYTYKPNVTEYYKENPYSAVDSIFRWIRI